MRLLFLFGLLMMFSCYSVKEDEKGTLAIDWSKAEKLENKYAKGFQILKQDKYYRITILNPQDDKIYQSYVLYPKNEEKPALKENEASVAYPISTFTSVSTTHLPFLTLIHQENSLVGFAGKKFVMDSDFISIFEKKDIVELGSDNNINLEKIIELMPDLLMVYPFESLSFNTVNEAGITVFYNTDYLELHPLGKTEWIKVFGLLYDEEDLAEKSFQKIEENYLSVVQFTDTIKNKPIVFTGSHHSSVWYVPGGKSFQAQFLKDAGVNYVWKDNEQNNSLNLAKEVVYEKCINADFWIKVASEKLDYTLAQLKNEDPAFNEFHSVKKQQVIFCNSNEKDYFGKGIVEPDIILKDLVYYFHPGVLKNYQPKYFELLK